MSRVAAGGRPRLLVYRIGQLGDTLVALPAIKHLRDRFHDHSFVLLTDRHPTKAGWVSSWDVFGPLSWFDEVVFYEATSSWLGQMALFARLGARLRRMRPQRLFNLVSREAGFSATRDRWFFRSVVNPAEYHDAGVLQPRGVKRGGILPRHEPEWRRLLRLVDASDDAPSFVLPIPDKDDRAARQILAELQVPAAGTRIAIGAGSKMEAKRWALDRFEAVGRSLLDWNAELQLILVGGSAEVEDCETLRRRWGARATNLAGRLSVFQSAAVLKSCAAYVGNDTGAMHLAAMAGTRCVAIFSARENPGSWEPYGNHHLVLRRDVPCSGCMLENCNRKNECLSLVGVGEVLAAAHRALQAQTKAVPANNQSQ